MEIYLVRHTKPTAGKEICYGQTDVPIDMSCFEATVKTILTELPKTIDAVYSSPVERCRLLTLRLQKDLYPEILIKYDDRLKEMNFGDWENKAWNDIDPPQLNKWMNDFVHEPAPGGESFTDVYNRAKQFIGNLQQKNFNCVLIVAHAGTIRSLVSYLQATDLKQAFNFPCDFGSVTRFVIEPV